jgi:probable F420-dependent oxidoreductase
MHIGALYPQTEFGNDPMLIRDFAQLVEELGFSHISAYEHIVGVNPDRPGGWKGPFGYEVAFQEPFALFSFMAGVTTKIGFCTRILILPQRQTALVAKQAATLDVLSGGRLRLGVGIGWNEVEYIVQNEEFSNRHKRLEEQVQLLRKLWTSPLVTYEGNWHSIPDAGINPLPVQQPIPIWFGGHVDVVLKRVAKIGDGWLPNDISMDETRVCIEKLNGYIAESGRDRTAIGIEPRLHFGEGNFEHLSKDIENWQTIGATHLSLDTMECGFSKPQEHLKALQRFAEFIPLHP